MEKLLHKIIYFITFLMFISNVYSFQFGDVFISENSNEVTIYFETLDYDDMGLSFEFINLNSQVLSISSTKDLSSNDPIWSLENLAVLGQTYTVADDYYKKRWKVILENKNLNLFENTSINFFDSSNTLIQTVSLKYIDYKLAGDFDLAGSILIESCSLYGLGVVGCENNESYLLVNNSGEYLFRVPAFVNGSKVVLNSESVLSFEKNSIESEKYSINVDNLLFLNSGIYQNNFAVFSNNKLKVLSSDNLSNVLWSSEFINEINFLSFGEFGGRSNVLIYGDSLGVWTNDFSSVSKISNDELILYDVFDSFSSYTRYSNVLKSDLTDLVLSLNTSSEIFVNLSSLGIGVGNSCNVFFKSTKLGNPDVNVSIDGNNYQIDSSIIFDSNYDIESGVTPDSFLSLKNKLLSTDLTYKNLNGETCDLSFKAGVNNLGVLGNDITFKLKDNSTVSMDLSNLKLITNFDEKTFANEVPKSVLDITSSSQLTIDVPFSVSGDACYVDFGVSSVGVKNDLFLDVGSSSVKLDTNSILSSGYQSYKNFDVLNVINYFDLDSATQVISNNLSNTNAEICEVSVGVVGVGDMSGLDLSFDVVTDSDLVSLATVSKKNFIEYTAQDSFDKSDSVLIGKNNEVSLSDNFVFDTNLFIGDVSKFKTCKVKLDTCYNGVGSNNLEVFFSSNTFNIDSNTVSACSPTASPVEFDVPCSLLETKPQVSISCSGCDNSNYFELGLQNQSKYDLNSFIEYGNSTKEYYSTNNLNPLFEVYTKESLDYQVVTGKVSCNALENNDLTLSCASCDTQNSVRVVGNITAEVSYETYTSYNFDKVSVPVSCEDLSSKSYNFNCPNCDGNNYYTVPVFNVSQGVINYNSNSISSSPYFNVLGTNLEDNSSLDVSVSCNQIPDKLNIKCDLCSENANIFFAKTLTSSDNLALGNLTTNGGLILDVKVTNSYDFSEVSVPISCNQAKNVSFSCFNCDQDNQFNLGLVSSKSGNSFSDTAGVLSLLSGEVDFSYYNFEQLVGDEYVGISSLGNLVAYDSLGNELFEKSISGFSYRYLVSNDLTTDIGKEIFVSNENELFVYSSEGNLIDSFTGFNKPKFEVTDKLFVINSNLNYVVYDYNLNVFKTGNLLNADGVLVDVLKLDVLGDLRDEIIVVTKDSGVSKFVIFDNTFSQKRVLTIDKYFNNFEVDKTTTGVILASSGYDVTKLSLSAIDGIEILVDGVSSYNYVDDFVNKITLPNLNGSVNSFMSSEVFSGIMDIFVPLKFVTSNFNPEFLADLTMIFSLDSDELVSEVLVDNFNFKSNLFAGQSYFADGVQINYNNDFAPLKIKKFSNLPGYVVGGIEVYDKNSLIVNSCDSSSFQDLDKEGFSNGCDFGLFYSINRDKDYFLYNDKVVPVIESSSTLDSNLLGNYLNKKISLNSSYSTSSINYVVSKINSIDLSDNSYSSINFLVKDENNLSISNVSLSPINNCYLDDFVKGSEKVLTDFYTKFNLNGKNYYACSQIVNENVSEINFVIEQLDNGEEISYGTFGLINDRPSVSNVTFDSYSFERNRNQKLNYSVLDLEGDDVQVIFQVYSLKQSKWVNLSVENISTTPGVGVNREVNFQLGNNYVGIVNYKIIVKDFERVSKNYLGDKIIEQGTFEVLNRQLDIVKVDTGLSRDLVINVYENGTLDAPNLGDIICNYYQTDSVGNNPSLLGNTLSNVGNSTCSLQLPSFYNPDTYYYYVVVSSKGFDDFQSEVLNQTFKSDLLASANLGATIFRTSNEDLVVSLTNSENNIITEQGVYCNLEILGETKTVTSDSNGKCTFTSFIKNIPNLNVCSIALGQINYEIYLTNYNTNKYFVDTNLTDSVFLKDNITLSIDSPVNSIAYDTGDNLVFDLGILDSCGNSVNVNNGDVFWKYLETDTGDFSVISTKQNDNWIIPADVFGSIDLQASVDSLMYAVVNTSVLLSVDDVLNIQITTEDEYSRHNNSLESISAQITTGNGLAIASSEYTGTWSGYRCDWFVENSLGQRTIYEDSLTNSNGQCFSALKPTCDYNVGEFKVGVILSGNLNPTLPVFENVSQNDVVFYDDFSNAQISPRISPLYTTGQADDVFYGNENQLSLEFSDSCNNFESSIANPIWSYVDSSRGVDLIFGDGFNVSYIPSSIMRGSSSVVVNLNDSTYYRFGNVIENITIVNTAKITDLIVPSYLTPNAVNQISCRVSVSGVSDLSFYQTEFDVGGNRFNVSTDSNGLAVLNINSNTLNTGAQEVYCRIYDFENPNYKIEADNSTYQFKELNLPDDLSIIGNVIFGNREYDLTKSSIGNIIYPHNMNNYTVYRKSIYPLYGPEKLYAGVEFATIGAVGTSKEGQQILVDGANVSMSIYRTSNGNLIDTVSCIQDPNKSNLGLTNPRDSIDNYHLKNCNLEWNPDNLPVGEYNVVISAAVPGQTGWTSEVYNADFEIWGILNSTLTIPAENARLVVNQNNNFNTHVYDEFGTRLDSSSVSVDYLIRDASENCYGVYLGTVSGGSDNTFAKTMNIYSINNYVVNDYRINDNWKIFTKSYGDFYETLDTYSSYELGPVHTCNYFWKERTFIDENNIYFDYPVNVDMITPEAAIIAPIDIGENSGKMKFVCRVRTFHGTAVPYAPTKLSCDGCNTINPTITQNGDSTGIIEKYITPVVSDYGNSYDFTCDVDNLLNIGNGNRLVVSGPATRNVLMSETLGTGWGDLPENYTFPTLSVGAYSDSSCSQPVTWVKSANAGDVYIGFSTSKGSDDLQSYRIEQSPITGSFPGPTPSEGSLIAAADSKCVRFSAMTKSNGVNAYTFKVKIQDESLVSQGSFFEKSVTVYIDDVGPKVQTITVEKPYYKPGANANVFVNLNPLTIGVDGLNDMKDIRYSEDTAYDKSFSKDSEGNWSASVVVPGSSGTNTFNLRIRDQSLYKDDKTFSIFVDDTEPTINTATVDSGCAGLPLTYGTACSPNTNFQIDVSDDNQIDRVRVTGSGLGNIYDSGTNGVNAGTFSKLDMVKNTNSLGDGTYAITFEAWDEAGNRGFTTVNLKVIKTGVVLNSLTQSKTYLSGTGDTADITGTVSSNVDLTIKEVISQSVNQCVASGQSCGVSAAIDASGFVEGKNTVTITAKDSLDNPTSKNFDFYLDTTLPVVTITTLVNDQYVKGSISVKANVVDVNRDNSLVSFTIGSCTETMTYISANQFSKSFDTTKPCVGGDGTKTLTVSATDKSGKVGSQSIDLKIDNTLPVVVISDPADGLVTENTHKVLATITEANFANAKAKVDSEVETLMICSGSGLTRNCEFDVITTGYSDGDHSVTVKATDNSGNQKSLVRNFKIDNNAPTINIYKVSNSDGRAYTSGIDGNYISGNMKLFATINDAADEGVDTTYDCIVDGTTYDMVSEGADAYSCTIDTTGISDGTYIFTVQAKDTLDNLNSKTVSLNVDNLNPVITGESFSGSLIKSGDSQTFSLTAGEPLYDICKVFYSDNGVLDGGDDEIVSVAVSGNTCGTTYSMSEGAGVSGNKFILVELTDRAGNKAVKSYDFVLDNAAPIIRSFGITNAEPSSPVTGGFPGVSPLKNMSWSSWVDENNGVNNLSRVYIRPVSGIGVDTNLREDLVYNGGINRFELTDKLPTYFGGTEGTTVFEVVAQDLVGNVGTDDFTFFISNSPPVINSVTSDVALLEVAEQSVVITSNITATPVTLRDLTFNIAEPDGNTFVYNFPQGGFTSPDSFDSYTFTPRVAGFHSVEVVATNIGNKNQTQTFTNVFNAVGTTSGSLTLSPQVSNADPIYVGEDYSFDLQVKLDNDGLARMKNSQLIFSGDGLKVDATNSIVNCGTILTGNFCLTTVRVTLDENVGNGNKLFFVLSNWKNVDSSNGFVSDTFTVNIDPTNRVRIISNELEKFDLNVGFNPQNIGLVNIQNYGNDKLDNVDISIYNGTLKQGLDNSDFTISFTPASYSSLAVSESKTFSMDMFSATARGNYNGYLKVDSTECLDDTCRSFVFTNISIFGKADSDFVQTVPLNNVIDKSSNVVTSLLATQGAIDFHCKYFDSLNVNSLIQNYPAELVLDSNLGESILLSNNTYNLSGPNVPGSLQYIWNFTTYSPGDYSLICRPKDDDSNFVKAGAQAVRNVTLIGNIIPTISYDYPATCLGSLYLYDSIACNNVNVTVNLKDFYGYPVINSQVNFTTNATEFNTLDQIGSCYTDNLGTCEINWNPDVLTAGIYNVSVLAGKSYYNSGNTSSEIQILGGYGLKILSPLDNILIYQDNYNFDFEVTDIDGSDITNSLSYNTTWSLESSAGSKVLSSSRAFNWNIDNTVLGNYNLTAKIQIGPDEVIAQRNVVVVRDTLIGSLTVENDILFRESLDILDITQSNVSVLVTDSATGLNVNNSNVMFKLNGVTDLGTCQTDVLGTCKILWNPSINLEAGVHNVSAFVSKQNYYNKSFSDLATVKVYVEPKWNTPSTISGELSNQFNMPLVCEVYESYKTVANPTEKFDTKFYMHKPAVLPKYVLGSVVNVDGVIYSWNSEDATNVTAQFSELFVGFDTKTNISVYETSSPVEDLGFNNLDTVSVEFNELSGGTTWDLLIQTPSGFETVFSGESSLSNSAFIGSNKQIKNVYIVFNGGAGASIKLSKVVLEQTITEETLEIGEAIILGSQFSSNPEVFGNLENFVGEDSIGFRSSANVNSLSSSEFNEDGDRSLGLNVSGVATNGVMDLEWNSPNLNDVSSFASLGFVVNNPNNLTLNLTVSILDETNCLVNFDLGEVKGKLSYPDINLSQFNSICNSNLDKLVLSFENVGQDPVEGAFYVDRFELFKSVLTENALASLNFHPYEYGDFRFSCEISDVANYVVKNSSKEKIIKLINSGSSADAGESAGGASDAAGAAASAGSVLSFELDLIEGDYVSANGAKGELETVKLYNLISSSRTFNISSSNNNLINFEGKNSTIVEMDEDTKVSEFIVSFDTTNIVKAQLEEFLLVTDIVSGESISVPIKLTLVDVNINVINPTSSSKLVDVLGANVYEINSNVEFNSSASYDGEFDKFGYEFKVANEVCETDYYGRVGDGLNIGCMMPFVKSNMLEDLIMRVNLGGSQNE